MRARWRALVIHFEWDQSFRRSVFFCFHQNVTACEIRFGKINKETEPGFDRVSFRRKIGAVERIAHLETERVARPEAARLDPKVLSFFEYRVPKLHCIAGAKEDFHAVFASVTGPRHRKRHSIDLKFDY